MQEQSILNIFFLLAPLNELYGNKRSSRPKPILRKNPSNPFRFSFFIGFHSVNSTVENANGHTHTQMGNDFDIIIIFWLRKYQLYLCHILFFAWNNTFNANKSLSCPSRRLREAKHVERIKMFQHWIWMVKIDTFAHQMIWIIENA